MRVVVCTMFSPAYQELADLTVPNMQEYAACHGYDTHIIHVEDQKWAFKKHETFKELFEKGYDLIWYRDVDGIIVRIDIPITKYVENAYDFYITEDASELNGGSILLKGNFGKWFNDVIWEHRGRYENEQNFINKAATEYLVRRSIKVLPQTTINAYDHRLYPECANRVGVSELGDLTSDSLFFHVPALSLEKRLEVLKNAKIIR